MTGAADELMRFLEEDGTAAEAEPVNDPLRRLFDVSGGGPECPCTCVHISVSMQMSRRGMQIQSFTCNPFQTNCYVCHDGREAVIIDPSCATEEEAEQVENFVEDRDLVVRHLLLTHAHIDHIFGCARFADRFGMGFFLHRDDRRLLEEAEAQARTFGVSIDPPPEPGGYLDEGDRLRFGGVTMRVLHTPGHSPGSISFYDEDSRSVVAGDVLFRGSIGRTDLWRGSLPALMASIFQKLMPLGDDVCLWPGHGPETTIGSERASNPFLTSYESAS